MAINDCPYKEKGCKGEIIERIKPGAWTGEYEVEKVCSDKDFHLQQRIKEILALANKKAAPS